MTPEKDPISGQKTTGHEWNGIKELNTPIPLGFRVWLWGSIATAALLWVLYPSFPYVTNALNGVLGYSSREAVQSAVDKGQAQRQSAFSPFETMDINALAADTSLRSQYQSDISVLFRDNCAACHGRYGSGQTGFPNLTDAQWLWSGSPEEIEYTIAYGINADHDDTRSAEMPAIGQDDWLAKTEIEDVIEYVLSLSNQPHDAESAARGTPIFADTCASCHNDSGVGGYENGAPNLTDTTWIYGGTREDLQKTIHFGRKGVMPAWTHRLTEAEIKQLTLYVLWQGQDDSGS